MRKHLAIFHKWAIEDILSGKKQVEARFSKTKLAPFGQVAAGDTVFMKPPGEPVVGEFAVNRVFYFDHPTETELAELKKKYGARMSIPDHFWLKKTAINYVTLMFVGKCQKFLTPTRQVKKRDLRGWVVL